MQNLYEIDPNFLKDSTLKHEDIQWFDARNAPFSIHGLAVLQEDGWKRMPQAIANAVNPGVASLNSHTAGGRIRFCTDSPYVAVRVHIPLPFCMYHMPLTGLAGTDILLNGEPYVTFAPQNGLQEWFEGECANPFGLVDVQLNLPLYNGVRHYLVGVAKGSQILPAKPYTIAEPIVFYGSSITQGGCASRPANAYQGFLCRWLDADYVNLGFSGNARGETVMADYIAGLPMGAFVMDYDHNAPHVEHLLATHKPFFEAIRCARPELPILLVTRPDWALKPQDAMQCRDVVYHTYEAALATGDTKVWFLDGNTLWGTSDRGACSMDGCHPNDLGFYRMAEAMLPYLKLMLQPNRRCG